LKRIAIILLLILLFILPLKANAKDADAGENTNQTTETPEELKKLYALSAVLMDADTGRILYEKNGQDELPMASTTKIMTCILALENGSLEDEVTVSAYAASMPDVQLNIRQGERYRLLDLLYSMMLESHNDSSVAVAEHIGGSVEAFAEMMNQKARDLGCYQTHFVTPNGLDAEDAGGRHSTTAEDLARIMSYCLNNEKFLEITGTKNYSFQDLDKKRSFSCYNHNALLSMMESAITGKTGFTGQAGYCYVGAVRADGRTFTAAVLGCGWPPHKTYKWSDIRTLVDYGMKNYEVKDIFEYGRQFENAAVVNGRSDEVGLVMEEEELRLLIGEKDQVEVVYDVPQSLEAPVYEHQSVGSVKYIVSGEVMKVYPVYTAGKVEKVDYLYCLRQILEKFWLGVDVIGLWFQ
jgi:D-alanyl-D-alanine carboxypeptidase (penicillin-binding protein 5/6)